MIEHIKELGNSISECGSSPLLNELIGHGAGPFGETVINTFMRFIIERHKIFIRRYIGKYDRPWTKDWVLRDNKFTNIYRELDRGTVWLLDNIKGNDNQAEMLWNIFIYRWFNRVETIEKIGGYQRFEDWDHREFYAKLREVESTQGGVFTSAHMVTGVNFSGASWGFGAGSKLKNYVWLINELKKNINEVLETVQEQDTMEGLWVTLKRMNGIGSFVSYEVAVDINYCGIVNLDENEWANPGPGCQRGINWIFTNLDENQTFGTEERYELEYKTTVQIGGRERAIEIMYWLQDIHYEYCKENLGFDFMENYPYYPLTMRNIEHSLCEFQKYFKTLLGIGKTKCGFSPTTNLPELVYDPEDPISPSLSHKPFRNSYIPF